MRRHSGNAALPRRLFMLGAMKGAVLAGVAARDYYLQALHSEKYKALSDQNRIKRALAAAPRGKLLDRNGQILAENRRFYSLMLTRDDKRAESEKMELAAQLKDVLKLSVEEEEKVLAKLVPSSASPAKFPPPGTGSTGIVLLERVTWDQAAAAESRRAELKGVYVTSGFLRYYPYGKYAGHVTGYVGAPDRSEITKDSNLRVDGAQAGKDAAELSFEPLLRGAPGVHYTEVNARSKPVRELSRLPGRPGDDVKLSLDVRLQTFLQAQFEGKSGCATVLDVETGGIMAYVSAPGFDPNLFVGGIASSDWRTLLENPDRPLLNRPAASRYPPGSTFKPVVALAMLEAGVSPGHQVHCPGYYALGEHIFHCWNPYGHGTVDVHKAIRESCNVFFYSAARMIGAEPIINAARRFGFGQKTGVALQHEAPGLVPDPEWKRAKLNQPWLPGDSLNMAIGQGFVQTTPLQLAAAALALAGGQRLTPRLGLDSASEPGLPGPSKLDFPADALSRVRAAMEAVVNDPHGTAHAYALPDRKFSFAGKTGTVQVISKKARKKLEVGGDKGLLEQTEHHGLFIGYSPIISPKAAFSIVVEHGGAGSKAAAPVAQKIAMKVNELYFGGPPV